MSGSESAAERLVEGDGERRTGRLARVTKPVIAQIGGAGGGREHRDRRRSRQRHRHPRGALRSADRAHARQLPLDGEHRAPSTLAVTKAPVPRLLAVRALPDGDDFVARTYARADFREGVRAFLEKRKSLWTGGAARGLSARARARTRL